MIIKPFLSFGIVIMVILSISCHKDEIHGPYDPSGYIPKLSAKINEVEFDPEKITTFSPINKDGNVEVIARKLDDVLDIEFPVNCGLKNYNFPSDQGITLMMNNKLCESGKLSITKYDSNLVEGIFEFTVQMENKSKNITKGFFSIVYRIN